MILEIGILIILLLLSYTLLMKKPKGLPPGDWGLPILGRIPRDRKGISDMVEELRSKHGNMFSVKMGSRIFVFLTDYKLIKSAFSKAELSGRPEFYTFLTTSYFTPLGLNFANGHVWLTNRKFTLKALSEFGMGKSALEPVIDNEISDLLDCLSKNLGSQMPFNWSLFNVAVVNIVWQLSAGKRYNLNDKEIQSIFKASMKAEEIMNDCAILDIFPLTVYLPNVLKNLFFHTDELVKQWEIYRMMIDEVIEEHKKSFDKNVIRDLIDMYLLDLEQGAAENEEDKFKKDLVNLNIILLNLFVAGSDTTAVTLRYFCLYLCKYPEVQEKIQQEIDCNIGVNRRPSLADRERLPYLDATLHEINRIISLAPIGVFHSATEDTELDGYKIPKNTIICSCLEVCHMSPEYFEEPKEFRPERFLNSHGKVDSKKEGYMPFSTGRRSCIGESLANMELFLFVSAIFQKFKICGVENKAPDLSPDVANVFINIPKPYSVVFSKRENYDISS